jgi:hypothetical protein
MAGSARIYDSCSNPRANRVIVNVECYISFYARCSLMVVNVVCCPFTSRFSICAAIHVVGARGFFLVAGARKATVGAVVVLVNQVSMGPAIAALIGAGLP